MLRMRVSFSLPLRSKGVKALAFLVPDAVRRGGIISRKHYLPRLNGIGVEKR
jgi:hypothetical protein